MPHWLLKSAVHHVISHLPRRQFWNAILRKHLTRSFELSRGELISRVASGQRHFDAFRSYAPKSIPDFTVLEVGTGWYPVHPVAMFLCGAERVWTWDLESMLDAGGVRMILAAYLKLEEDGGLEKALPSRRADRIDALREALSLPDGASPSQLLAPLGIEVHVGDASQTRLPAGSVNLFFSHSVLQYIPPKPLSTLLEEFQRLARPLAVQSHHINTGDQYHYFDRRIGPLNYLRYSSRLWSWLDSPIVPQTRLRISDYRALFHQARWKIVAEDNQKTTLEELQRMRIAPEFARYDVEDLIVIGSWIAAVAE